MSGNRIVDCRAREMLGCVVGASVAPVAWTPGALADLARARRRSAFWARWHPLRSGRERNRRALAILDGLERGCRAASFYAQAIEHGGRYAKAAQAKKKLRDEEG